MILIKGDLFTELMIGSRQRITKELVEEKYNELKKEFDKIEENIYDETTRKKAAIQKLREINKLEEWIERKKVAYLYCSSPENILLRNIIIDLDANSNVKPFEKLPILRQIQEEDLEVKGNPILRKTTKTSETLDTRDISIIETERFDLIDVIEKLPVQVKKYKIIVPSLRGKFEYVFYSEGINTNKLASSIEYREAVLKAIELNKMQGKNNYIGKIEEDEKGEYVEIKNRKIEGAVEFEQGKNQQKMESKSMEDNNVAPTMDINEQR